MNSWQFTILTTITFVLFDIDNETEQKTEMLFGQVTA